MILITATMAWLAKFSTNLILSMGYPGVFFLMTLESMIFPMPSELVMPFAGYLAFRGELGFLGVVIASSLGSIFGSLLSYMIGRYAGTGVIKKFGKYLLLDENDLEKTERWFIKGGEKTILISRFIPVVRHFISIPAGVAKMDIKKFCIYTLIGATIWNTFLACLGYLLGANWFIVRQYSEYISIFVFVILVAGLIYFVYKHGIKRLRK